MNKLPDKMIMDKYSDKPTYWFHSQNMDWDDNLLYCERQKVCEDCGCPDIEERLMKWYKVNGGEYCSDGEDDPYYWCPYCENHPSDVVDFEEWAESIEEQFFTKGD